MGAGAAAAGELPVSEVLPALVAALRSAGRVVLCAPPGSGKTTLVPPALVDSGLCERGEVWVLQPRRVAARAVARAMAARRGEAPGESVGYEVRFERAVSARTRIRFITEGILTSRIQRDPELGGVAAVVLDEFHERSLHADLALALTAEVQGALRPDLLLVVMSATLDPEPLARFLGGCPVVRAEGRSHPLTVGWRERGDPRAIGADAAEGVRQVARAMAAGEAPPGDILAFLPGVREIDDAARSLSQRPAEGFATVLPLHGRLPPALQDRALAPSEVPRVVLATNLAETSLTIPGVSAVVDTGLCRVSRHDVALGTDRLELSRISRASAEQRGGRAGRLGPGHVLRLWPEREHAALPAFDEPELRRADLSWLLLQLRVWGVADPGAFALFEAPDPRALERAAELLDLLGATEGPGGPLTAAGREMAALPTSPRLARALLAAREAGVLPETALVAAWLEEGRRLPGERGPADLGTLVAHLKAAPEAERLRRTAHTLVRRLRDRSAAPARGPVDEGAITASLLSGFPDRLVVRARPDRPELTMSGGRGGVLEWPERTRAGRYLLALDVDAGRRGAFARTRVRLAVPVDPGWLEGRPQVRSVERVRWDAERERVVAERERSLGTVVLERVALPLADRALAAELLEAEAARDPSRALTLDEAACGLLRRLQIVAEHVPEAGLPADAQALLRAALPGLCAGLSSLAELRRAPVAQGLLAGLDHRQRQALEEHAPQHVEVPSGSRIRLRWPEDGPPILAVKVQEVFGWTASPTIARGRVPVVLHLLDPAGRPLQVTSDLGSFWRGAWSDARKQMRSRYPKHRWPEDPLTAEPSRRTTRPR
ncbi:MAG: ATP-dependent helicase HrpB [Deltaproteobacteria bacterium]|nr:ATP-dependent helicase HrpB [Deltaproteobacteria bacterium]